MKRINSRTRELFLELLVGSFMFVVLLSLSFFTIILSRENFFAPTYPVEIVFDDVMGLRDGDNVMIRGMAVGKVRSLALRDDGVHVLANLNRPLNIHSDYAVRVVQSSVLGGRYLQIDTGGAAGEMLPEGVILQGEMPRDLMASAAVVVDDFKEITAKIRSGEGTLGRLVNDNALYDDARAIVAQVKNAVGSETGMLHNLEGTLANLNMITTKINQGQGTLGRLVNDEGLYDETSAMIGDARRTLDDIRETSPLVTFTSILFGAL